jgi:hypothetical protein
MWRKSIRVAHAASTSVSHTVKKPGKRKRSTQKMKLRRIRAALWVVAVFASGEGVFRAQEAASVPVEKPATEVATAPHPKMQPVSKDEHRFWDKTNDWLFAGVAASRTLDYFSTLNMRRRGRQEILWSNDVVDNHAAFATIEAAGTATSIGAAYLFHRYGHHKLERWTSIVHIGLATTGAVRNYSLKTFHSTPTASNP